MAARNGKRPPVGPLQRLRDQEATDEARAPLVNEFAAQHGDYDAAGTLGIGRKVQLNRGGTALARWKRAGHISETQEAAILHVQRLWEIVGAGSRVTANLERTIFGAPGDGSEREVGARRDLHRIRDLFHPNWWDVFENVCRFDEPAGVAGSRLGERNEAYATAAARRTVCMVADFIYLKERMTY